MLLIGSCISDIHATAPSFRVDAVNQASSIGRVRYSAGGVCLNVARALRGLGQGEVHMVSAVGSDGAGRDLLDLCTKAGIHKDGILTIEAGRTATVLCLFNNTGEVVYSLADVSILEDYLTPEMALRGMDRCGITNGIVVTDGDLSSGVLEAVCKRAHRERCTVVFDPATVAKASRCVACLSYIDYVAPNVDELAELARAVDPNGLEGRMSPERGTVGVPEVFLRALPAVDAVLGKGAGNVLLTAGEYGAGLYCYCGGGIRLAHCPALPTASIASVNGAGDCLVAGFVRGLSLGRHKEDSLALGVASAWEALQIEGNVPDAFDGTRLRNHVRRQTVTCFNFYFNS